ncbi:MAG TPA: tetratricopeptide repeat protein [Terriglobales bacterium]
MKTGLKVAALLSAALLLISATGCNKLKARDRLNKGVAAYKNARYESAINFFKEAVSLDPTLLNAKLYLATAYAQQYIPGVTDPDNVQNANNAIDQYKSVLAQDPKNVNSIKGIAFLYLNMKKLDDAKTYYQKAIDLDPNDPEAYYSVGVIDWTKLYMPMQEERNKEGVKPDEPLKDKKLCAKLREQDAALLQDGMDKLNRAMQLRQDYDDAMAYMNLIYRQKADRECDQPEERAADLKTADGWQDKTLDARKRKAEKQAAAPQGASMDNSSSQ